MTQSVRRWLTVSDDPSHKPTIGRWADIDAAGLVDGETPIEDYPLWLLTDHPVTEAHAWAVWIKATEDGEGAI